MSDPAYSIVVPAFNESTRLGPSLDQILGFFNNKGWDAEIVVVNDGSRDNTAAITREYAQRDQRIRLVENPGNRGKGYSVRNGMRHARGAILIFTDADLSSPISEAEKLVQAIWAGAEVAIGSRWVRPELMTSRQPLYRQLLGRAFNLLPRIILGLNFKDTQCGLKAFTRRAAGEIFPRQRIERWGFDPELLFLARRQHLPAVEVPVEWAHDEHSRINPFRDGLIMAEEVLLIRWYALCGRYRHTADAAIPNERRERVF